MLGASTLHYRSQILPHSLLVSLFLDALGKDCARAIQCVHRPKWSLDWWDVQFWDAYRCQFHV